MSLYVSVGGARYRRHYRAYGPPWPVTSTRFTATPQRRGKLENMHVTTGGVLSLGDQTAHCESWVF